MTLPGRVVLTARAANFHKGAGCYGCILPPFDLPRVLHVVESLETGGLERLVHDLVLARGAAATEVVCLKSIGPFGESLRAHGVSVHVAARGGGIPGAVRRLYSYIRQRRPGIVHCHNLFPFLIGSLSARAAGAVPVVMSKHGALLPKTGLARHLVRVLLRDAWAVGVSPETADLLRGWIGPGARSVRFIPNGIATAPYDTLPERGVARAALGYPAASFVIGIVSRVTVCKRHVVLIDAFARVRERIPGALLVIVGSGPRLPEVKERVEQLALGDAVLLLGERRDIPLLLASFDVFCLPSEMEGMPMTILEAMAARLPVVATAVGGIPEIVESGTTGCLIPPNSVDDLTRALLDLAADPARSCRMGSTGRERLLASLSLDQTLEEYEKCYREAVKGKL